MAIEGGLISLKKGYMMVRVCTSTSVVIFFMDYGSDVLSDFG